MCLSIQESISIVDIHLGWGGGNVHYIIYIIEKFKKGSSINISLKKISQVTRVCYHV